MHLNRLIWYLIAKVMSLNLYMPILINFKIPIFKRKIDGKRGELTNKIEKKSIDIFKYIYVTPHQ